MNPTQKELEKGFVIHTLREFIGAWARMLRPVDEAMTEAKEWCDGRA